MTHQVAFISHGGGPLPLLGDPQHAQLVDAIRELTRRLRRPNHIVVISAHWESDPISVTSGHGRGLLYDYYGFPEESYQIQYSCKGDQEVSDAIVAAIQKAGLAVTQDQTRGYDHGVFVPLKLMFPDADIPVTQVSLHPSLNPGLHLRLGEALSTISKRDVLFIGSGFSFHNMKAFFEHSDASASANTAFENWIDQTIMDKTSIADAEDRLMNWESAPGARHCHPREEHLLPLHVCYGIKKRSADFRQKFEIFTVSASNYAWTF
jgi:4,5-DOPA dioxygenase extradiol